MDNFNKKQIEEAKKNINGLNDLIKIEKSKPAVNANLIAKYEFQISTMEHSINILKGNKEN